jgi:hypothetical protein
MRLHHEVLDEDRKKIFEKLGGFKKWGFLAGGTALALQLGHRISYDFDVFCSKEIENYLIAKARETFPVKTVSINSREEFTFFTRENVKISFIHYPFDLKKHLIKNKERMDFLSVLGVAVAKAYTLNRRGSYRDYIDLYFILEEKHYELRKIISEAKKVYGEIFSEKLFLAQLVYTDDISPKEKRGIKFLRNEISPEGVVEFFARAVKGYLV